MRGKRRKERMNGRTFSRSSVGAKVALQDFFDITGVFRAGNLQGFGNHIPDSGKYLEFTGTEK
jgi:hypothetical protein